MKSSHLKLALLRCIASKRPAFVWGPPGVGKSDLIVQVAAAQAERLVAEKKIKKAQDFGLVDFRMAMRDPTDIKGFPMPHQESQTMRFFRDGELPTTGYGILFMDELNSAMPATMASGMQLTLPNHKGEHRVGDYVLPEGWTIMAAGNRETDRGVTHTMPTPLANRFTHYDYEVNSDDWMEWALDNGISGELLAFIRFKPDLLFKFDPKTETRAFPTPRSWVATEHFTQKDAKNDPAVVKSANIMGTVGAGAGAEYIGFLQTIDQLPTIEEIRLNPKKARLPDESAMSARLAVTTLCAAHVGPDTYDEFSEYMDRLNVEMQALFNRDSVRRNRDLSKNKTYIKWALKHHDLVVGS